MTENIFKKSMIILLNYTDNNLHLIKIKKNIRFPSFTGLIFRKTLSKDHVSH